MLLKLDYFVDTDLFLTDTAMLADLVLPVCTSYERGELETYPGCYAWYTKPAIDRVGESKSDTEIIAELAKKLGLGDEELEAESSLVPKHRYAKGLSPVRGRSFCASEEKRKKFCFASQNGHILLVR